MRVTGIFVAAAVFAAFAFSAGTAEAADERAAKGFAKDNNCFKCHSVSREKDGPSFKKVAKKYKDKPDGAAALTTHVTSEPMVEVEGKKEKHRAAKGDASEIKNLVEWILSL